MNLFAAITKVEEQDDGTIMVFGVASSGSKDEAGEVITPAAMKAAIPGYFAIGGTGALREMHQPSAAGTVPEAVVDGDGVTRIGAHVVDPLAITKVKKGVYKGFSVGGKVTGRDPKDSTIITGIKLVEISLVDRPCNPDAVISMWKADDVDLEENDMGDRTAEGYQPTNDEVKAEAAELAKAAGKIGPHAYKDYVAKAREGLIAKHVAETQTEDEAVAAGDETERGAESEDEADKEAAVVVEDEAEKVAETDASTETPTDPEEGAETAKVDPAAALEAALDKAAAAAKDPEEETSAAPVTPGLADLGKTLALIHQVHGEDLEKGLYHVGRLAELIDSLASLQSSTVWEAKDEADGSQVPQMLTDGIRQLGSTLLAMAQEEVAELLAALQARGIEIGIVVVDGCDEVIVLAAQTIDLIKADEALMEKAGARHSKADLAKIQSMHDHSASLGAKCDKANCEKDDDVESAAGVDDLAKITAERDRFADVITKSVPRIEALEAEIVKLKDQPMPAKTAASAAAVISKEADAGGPGSEAVTVENITSEQFQKAVDSLPEDQRGELLLRLALKQPRLISNVPQRGA